MNFSTETISLPRGVSETNGMKLVLHNYPTLDDPTTLRGYEGRVYIEIDTDAE